MTSWIPARGSDPACRCPGEGCHIEGILEEVILESCIGTGTVVISSALLLQARKLAVSLTREGQLAVTLCQLLEPPPESAIGVSALVPSLGLRYQSRAPTVRILVGVETTRLPYCGWRKGPHIHHARMMAGRSPPGSARKRREQLQAD